MTTSTNPNELSQLRKRLLQAIPELGVGEALDEYEQSVLAWHTQQLKAIRAEVVKLKQSAPLLTGDVTKDEVADIAVIMYNRAIDDCSRALTIIDKYMEAA